MEDSHVSPALSLLRRESGLLKGKIGIACPQCRAKFRVVQTRIRVLRFLSWALLCACAVWFGEWKRRGNLVLDHNSLAILIISALCALVLTNRYLTPYLAQLRPAGDEEERLSYPLRSAYEGSSTSESEN